MDMDYEIVHILATALGVWVFSGNAYGSKAPQQCGSIVNVDPSVVIQFHST